MYCWIAFTFNFTHMSHRLTREQNMMMMLMYLWYVSCILPASKYNNHIIFQAIQSVSIKWLHWKVFANSVCQWNVRSFVSHFALSYYRVATCVPACRSQSLAHSLTHIHFHFVFPLISSPSSFSSLFLSLSLSLTNPLISWKAFVQLELENFFCCTFKAILSEERVKKWSHPICSFRVASHMLCRSIVWLLVRQTDCTWLQCTIKNVIQFQHNCIENVWRKLFFLSLSAIAAYGARPWIW